MPMGAGWENTVHPVPMAARQKLWEMGTQLETMVKKCVKAMATTKRLAMPLDVANLMMDNVGLQWDKILVKQQGLLQVGHFWKV
jgi:hypothetical protein